MKKSSWVLWFFMAVLTGAACLYVLLIGNPWKQIGQLYEGISGKEIPATETVYESAEEEKRPAYDTDLGNTSVSEAGQQTTKRFASSLFRSHRAITADYDKYIRTIHNITGETASFSVLNGSMDRDKFLEFITDVIISDRIEIESEYLPKYEMQETETSIYVNGTLNISFYSSEGSERMAEYLGLDEIKTAERYEIPYWFYLIKGDTGEWKIFRAGPGEKKNI